MKTHVKSSRSFQEVREFIGKLRRTSAFLQGRMGGRAQQLYLEPNHTVTVPQAKPAHLPSHQAPWLLPPNPRSFKFNFFVLSKSLIYREVRQAGRGHVQDTTILPVVPPAGRKQHQTGLCRSCPANHRGSLEWGSPVQTLSLFQFLFSMLPEQALSVFNHSAA